MLLRLAALIFLISAVSSVRSQEAVNDGLPPSGESAIPPKEGNQSAWIDWGQHPAGSANPQTAPDWVEAVNMTNGNGSDGAAKTIFRIRVAKRAGEFQGVYVRFFFCVM